MNEEIVKNLINFLFKMVLALGFIVNGYSQERECRLGIDKYSDSDIAIYSGDEIVSLQRGLFDDDFNLDILTELELLWKSGDCAKGEGRACELRSSSDQRVAVYNTNGARISVGSYFILDALYDLKRLREIGYCAGERVRVCEIKGARNVGLAVYTNGVRISPLRDLLGFARADLEKLWRAGYCVNLR